MPHSFPTRRSSDVAPVEVRPDGLDGGVFFRKIPALKVFCPGNPLGEVVPELRPEAGEPVITKQYASAFFGTSLASLLHAQGVDCLLIAGMSTSGCVRASTDRKSTRLNSSH